MSLLLRHSKNHRWISTLAVLGMLVVPALAHATGSGDGGAGSTGVDGTAGGDVGSGEGTASVPTTGEATGATSDHATGHATGDTEGSDPPDDDDGKGCSIGARGTLPGMMVLALLGLHAIRRRD